MQSSRQRLTVSLFILLLNVLSSNAFMTTGKTSCFKPSSRFDTTAIVPSSTTLLERRWNFNEGRGPWGVKKNAEIWNGRVAQMGFTIVLLQELITGKGVIAGFQDGDVLSYVMIGLGGVSVLALTAFLASKGKDNSISY
jgi:hypothetical protein